MLFALTNMVGMNSPLTDGTGKVMNSFQLVPIRTFHFSSKPSDHTERKGGVTAVVLITARRETINLPSLHTAFPLRIMPPISIII